jgi:hypothetical protein
MLKSQTWDQNHIYKSQRNIMGIETQSNNDMQQPGQKNGWLSDLPQFGQQSQFKPTLKKTQDWQLPISTMTKKQTTERQCCS